MEIYNISLFHRLNSPRIFTVTLSCFSLSLIVAFAHATECSITSTGGCAKPYNSAEQGLSKLINIINLLKLIISVACAHTTDQGFRTNYIDELIL